MFGLTEAQISEFGLKYGLGAMMLYMLFIIGELAYRSKAGKVGTFALFFVLAFGIFGFIIKNVIEKMWESNVSQFDNIAVIKKANVYFDGKCVSHTVQFADGTKKSIGVIMPATLTFNTGAPEIMETVAGACRYRLKGEDWKTCGAGQSFKVPGNSSFDIEVGGEPYHYVCHFG